jgi:hypothetical protein
MKIATFKLVLLISGIILLTYSCKKDTTGTDNGKNEVITNNGDITIKGSSNYEFSVDLEAAAYKITFKEKASGNLENVEIYIEIMGGWTSWMPGSIMALRASNWYEGSWIQSYSKKAAQRFKVTASGEYEITFQKLPLSQAAVNLPQNFSGSGGTFFGPMSISGNATFSIKCSDAKAGFTVILLDATTGNVIVNPDHTNLYTNIDANYKLINNINATVTKTGLSGTYLILVTANAFANYTIAVN